ncbi:DASS family sodium-coupled anion symporter [Leptospira borgpetersenii]|uniref:Sodium:sulfate symporter n=2 Tax=Leptospira borgpetersenii TaxID=174 RepID=Q04TH5_LEPBJ|nr:DASS family sodium-coupled anion symporter [Leptospira borgpetersenii]ABJ75795.1 Sodium:sulfate symporter [Leptospira borgpetersenii serovar Hardjo-bovis str. JB197]AMX70935.1 sodium:sulfate symporter [Leptospira borgpetersenii serovar Hardjo]TQE54975.1 DASS family sodium-coupled anion symporter [Leptospira borgpetersenii]
MKRDLILIIGTLLLIGILFFVQVLFEFPLSVAIMICIFVLAAVFWVAEPIPGYATSILVIFLEIIFFANPIGIPGFVFPQNKNPSAAVFLSSLADSSIILFLGGFVLAKACVKTGLDRFFANRIIRKFGVKSHQVLLGFMFTTGFISMWMSNTATTSMMIALSFPLLRVLPEKEPFRKALILGIPFAANIGGVGTPIGSPPNIIAMGILRQQGIVIPFGTWMFFAVPLVVVLILFAWILLMKLFPQKDSLDLVVEFQEPERGMKSFSFRVTSMIFLGTVVLWFTENLHGVPAGVVALLPLILFPMFGILNEKDINSLDWSVLILISGGIGIGVGFQQSGMGPWFSGILKHIAKPEYAISVLFFLCVLTLLLSTFMSNTAATNLLVPFAFPFSAILFPGSNVYLLEVCLGIALSASLAMSLPVSTPPNAIAYSVGGIEIKDMICAGLPIGIFGLIVVLSNYFAFF